MTKRKLYVFFLEFKQICILGYPTNFQNKRRPKERYNDTNAFSSERCKWPTQFLIKTGIYMMSLSNIDWNGCHG